MNLKTLYCDGLEINDDSLRHFARSTHFSKLENFYIDDKNLYKLRETKPLFSKKKSQKDKKKSTVIKGSIELDNNLLSVKSPKTGKPIA